MNTRLIKLLLAPPRELRDKDMLDDYNQAISRGVAVTITTRINTCSHYFIYEEDKSN